MGFFSFTLSFYLSLLHFFWFDTQQAANGIVERYGDVYRWLAYRGHALLPALAANESNQPELSGTALDILQALSFSVRESERNSGRRKPLLSL